MTITTTCHCCDAEIECEVYFGEDDEAADDVNPSECPKCKAKLNEKAIIRQAEEDAADAQLEREITRAEWRAECRNQD